LTLSENQVVSGLLILNRGGLSGLPEPFLVASGDCVVGKNSCQAEKAVEGRETP
jgi:hypothetical protein